MTDHSKDHLVLPEVSTSTDGTIVLELSQEHAETLADVLAWFRSYRGIAPSPAGYDPEVWDRVVIELRGRASEVHVPFLRSLGTPPADDPADIEGLARSLGQLS